MGLSKDKLDIIKSIKSDYAELVIKLNDFYTEKYYLNDDSHIRRNINEIIEKDDTSYYLIFSKKTIDKSEKFIIADRNISFENITKLKIILDIEDISSWPIWTTCMRRKTCAIIEKINLVENENLTDEVLKNILLKTPEKEVKEDKKYSLNDVIEIFKKIYICNPNLTDEIYYIFNETLDDSISQNNEEQIFFINEFEKFLKALKLENDRYEYIYDTICTDMDNLFSKYNFCNFKGNMCFSQRHKSLTNQYPKPKTDGCCFKVFRKCKHNNKDGTCREKCIACKMFSCPYISKCGVGIRTSELILMRAFFNVKQRRDSIYSFFTSKDEIIKKIKKHGTENLQNM